MVTNRFAAGVFELPPERLISICRLILAVFSLAAIYFDPTQPSRFADETYALLIGYIGFGAGLAVMAAHRPIGTVGGILSHGVDIFLAFALMLLTDGPTSPFFAFFTFILIAATLRWGARATSWTALVLIALFGALVGINAMLPAAAASVHEINRAVIRLAYFAVAAAMLTYLGAYLERSRKRLAHLANWPAQPDTSSNLQSLEGILAHAAQVVRVPRALVIWERADEDALHLAIYRDGGVTYERAPRAQFAAIVRAACHGSAFATNDAGSGVGLTSEGRCRFDTPLIDPDLHARFDMRSFACAPLKAEICSGYIFLLDRAQWTTDHLVLTRLVGSRLGIDLDHFTLRQRREREVAERERLRLARDMHDGLLQGLTAASLQLKLGQRKAEPAMHGLLGSVQGIITTEQRRLREFVDDARGRWDGAGEASRKLMDELNPVVREAGQRWGCDADLSVSPPGAFVTGATARNLSYFVSEAIANAARHGGAQAVGVDLEVSADEVVARIRDDGHGMPGLQGVFTQSELSVHRVGPRSLFERASEIGGEVTLSSSSGGACVALRLQRVEA